MPADASAALPVDPLWYRHAVIYQLHIKAFADGNGDGIGDFEGLLAKLDYLAELGVTAVWLLPFYPSPLRDDGYDIADYETVNPRYGDLGQFRRFLDEAHRRGLRVITELVINHTSDQHPWFQRARRAPSGSPERDFYVWSDTTDRYAETRIIFEDFEQSNWTWDPVAQQYFWHRFYSHQPDLNFDNPAVHEAVFAAMDHWLAMGVDGIRLDAIPYLYERDGTNCENLPETHAFLKALRARMDATFPGRMFLAEANQWPEDTLAYFGDGDECHTAFHFPVMPRLYMALARADFHPITDVLEQTPPIPEGCQWVMFLRNHDELTLEMVTDEERVEMRNHYAPEPRMRINAGIRRRLAPLMDGDRRRIEVMNALLFSMPGTPVLYYGDEIGMGDNVWLPDRDGVRTPMQWNAETNAGFSTADPQALYLPLITDRRFHYERVNVAQQQADPTSQWWAIRRLIGARRSMPVLATGGATFLAPDNDAVLAFVRTPAPGSADDPVLVVVNLSDRLQAVELDLAEYAGLRTRDVFGGGSVGAIGTGPLRLTLSPYAYSWLALARPASTATRPTLPAISPADADDPESSVQLDAVRAWLVRQPWFTVPAADVRRIRWVDGLTMPALDRCHGRIAVFEVDAGRRPAPRWSAMLAVVGAADGERLGAEHPEAVIARVGATRYLVDGSYVAAMIRAFAAPHLARPPRRGATLHVRTLGTDTGSTMDRLRVSLHHRVERGENPDVSMFGAAWANGFTAVERVLFASATDEPLVTVVDLPPGRPASVLGPGLDAATSRAIGEALGRFHDAVAGHSAERFVPVAMTSLAQRAIYQGVHGALRRAQRVAGEGAIDAAAVLRCIDGLRHGVLAATRQRILGSVTLDSFHVDGTTVAVVGLGGDGRAPLEERILKRSPLRDVAQLTCAIEDAAGRRAAPLVRSMWAGYEASGAALPPPDHRRLLVDTYRLWQRLTAVADAVPGAAAALRRVTRALD